MALPYRRLAIVLAIVAALSAAPEAVASMDGPCEATVATEDIVARETEARSEAIAVTDDGGTLVTMASERDIERLQVDLEIAGIRYTVHDDVTTGREWSRVVPVDEYAVYGIGVYKIVLESSGQGYSCEGATLIDVQGSPLETAAGAIAVGMVIVGGLGMVSFALRGGRTGLASIFATFLGLVFAVGVGTLLQQFGILYPTPAAAIGILLAGGVLGLIAGLIGSRVVSG
jgi:hypothetical protein